MNEGPEKWVPDAIAEQEDYLQRQRSCEGHLGRMHAWRKFGSPERGASVTWEQCVVCGCCRSQKDFRKKFGIDP